MQYINSPLLLLLQSFEELKRMSTDYRAQVSTEQ